MLSPATADAIVYSIIIRDVEREVSLNIIRESPLPQNKPTTRDDTPYGYRKYLRLFSPDCLKFLLHSSRSNGVSPLYTELVSLALIRSQCDARR